jgi:hypothetical protein
MPPPLVVVVVSHFLTKLPIQRDDLPSQEGVACILIVSRDVGAVDLFPQAADQSQHRRS